MIDNPHSAPHPARILIVDDDAANRDVLAIILVHAGMLIVTAACGADAFTAVAEQRVDLMLLDVMMPDMTGYQVLAKVRADLATRTMPIIMVTALNDRATRIRALRIGADDVLTKPLDRVALCLRVKQLLPDDASVGPGGSSDSTAWGMRRPQ